MRAIFLLVVLWLSCAPSCTREADDAALHNAGIAPGLLGGKNPCGALEAQPTQASPFSIAEMRVVSLVPQVDDFTSDLANASVLWEWAANAPPSLVFLLEGGECPRGALEYYSPTAPWLSDAALHYKYLNASRALPLSGNGPNPARLELGNSSMSDADYSTLRAPLFVQVHGKISVRYTYRRSYYTYECHQLEGGIACGCESHIEYGLSTFQKEVSHSRNFSVETGGQEWMWLSPPLAARLPGDGMGKTALFARRLPSNVSFYFAGEKLGDAAPYSLEVLQGECGEERVASRLRTGDSGALLFAVGNETVFPYQLVERNASYLPFAFNFTWKAGAGKGEFDVVVEDFFSNSAKFARNFSVRAAAPFSGNGQTGALAMRNASQSEAPAAYPLQAPGALMPGYSVLAALAALPFAIGAYGLMRYLHGKSQAD